MNGNTQAGPRSPEPSERTVYTESKFKLNINQGKFLSEEFWRDVLSRKCFNWSFWVTYYNN